MDPTEDELRELFDYGDDNLPPGVIVLDFAPAPYPFVQEGLRFLDEVPVMVYYVHPERRQDASIIQYLGELLAQPDYRLGQVVREELWCSHQPAFPQPPRSLGRSIPARRPPTRGTKLTHGGWR